MRETVLEVNDLNVWYRSGTGLRKRRHQVLHDVSFTLYRGEILGLVGESGSGKSTLARAVLGMESDVTGTVTHHTKRPQMVFQDPAGSLNPAFTVGRALAEPLYIYGKYDKAGVERRVRDTMALVGLDESYYDRYPHELSGGQKQRVCIGAALLLAMFISSAVGTLIPMFFKRIGVDPAVASGPLITTVNDLVAVVTYYGLSWLLLLQVLHLGS